MARWRILGSLPNGGTGAPLTQRCGEYIDPETCIDCGACGPVCPVEAIFTEEDVPESETAFTELNVQWFSDKGAVRAKVNELAPSSG
jgi:ferredoxin